MFEEFRRIIATLDKNSTVYLSNFTPKELFDEIITMGFTVKLLASNLQGSLDERAIKAFDPEENAHIISWPFLSTLSCDQYLANLQESHHFVLHAIKGILVKSILIDSIYREELSNSQDLDLSPVPCGEAFAIYLRPHMFCPKDEIIEELSNANVPHHSTIDALYTHPYFESVKQDHSVARECRLSFISLPLDVSEDKARVYAQVLLRALSHQSHRRCSF